MSCGRVGEDGDQMIEPNSGPAAQLCVKCKSADLAITMHKVSYCRDCFVYQYRHKFRHQFSMARRNLGKIGNKALVAFSGSPASFALLELVLQHLPVASEKQVRGPPSFIQQYQLVFVDDSTEYSPSSQETAKAISAILKEKYNIELIVRSLCSLFSQNSIAAINRTEVDLPVSALDASLIPRQQLHGLLQPLSSTSRTTLLASLRHQLLCSMAHELKFDLLLTAETSSKLASKTISGIAQGKGWGLGEEVAAHRRISQEMIALRPLATMLDSEITLANELAEIPDVQIPFQNKQVGKADINTLVDDFVNGLQRSFPSTVFTISRTAEKLSLRSITHKEGSMQSCAACGLPADSDAKNWRDANAITNFAPTSQISPSVAASPGLTDSLCYACLTILANPNSTSQGKPDLLPVPRFLLRQSIQDYLLVEEEHQST